VALFSYTSTNGTCLQHVNYHCQTVKTTCHWPCHVKVDGWKEGTLAFTTTQGGIMGARALGTVRGTTALLPLVDSRDGRWGAELCGDLPRTRADGAAGATRWWLLGDHAGTGRAVWFIRLRLTCHVAVYSVARRRCFPRA